MVEKTNAAQHGRPLISAPTLRRIYRVLLEGRMLAEHLALYQHDKSSKMRSARMNQLAALAALAVNLGPGDIVAPASIDPLLLCALGAPISSVLAQHDSLPKNILPPRASGDSFAMAADAAAALQRAGKRRVVVALATGSKRSSKVLEYAALHSLPIVSLIHQVNTKNLGGNDSSTVPRIPVDQQDAVAIYRVVFESIARARHGGGPTIIECRPYPLEQEDALTKMELYLQQKRLLRDASKKQMRRRFEAEL